MDSRYRAAADFVPATPNYSLSWLLAALAGVLMAAALCVRGRRG